MPFWFPAVLLSVPLPGDSAMMLLIGTGLLATAALSRRRTRPRD